MDTVNFYDKRYADAQQQEIDDTVANYKKRMTDGNIKKINDFLRTNATADLDTKNDKLADPYQVALRATA